MRRQMERGNVEFVFDDQCSNPDIKKFLHAVILAWKSGNLTRKELVSMLAPHFDGIKMFVVFSYTTSISLYWGPPCFLHDWYYWFMT